jgi:hypothetical protein
MTTNDDQKPMDTTEADSAAGVSCAAAAGLVVRVRIAAGLPVNQAGAIGVFSLWIFEDGSICTLPMDSKEVPPDKRVRDYMQIAVYPQNVPALAQSGGKKTQPKESTNE